MAFDFMKNFLGADDDERFARLCEAIEEAIREAEGEEEEAKLSELEVMQALDFIGFNLFRDNWEEFKKMDFPRDLGFTDAARKRSRNFIH